MTWMQRLLERLRQPTTSRLDLDAGSLRDSLVALIGHLGHRRVDCALVGGIALAARGIVRGTRDLDLLIAEEAEPRVHELMSELGFETLARGGSVSSYLLDALRVDYLIAKQARGRAMLQRAELVTVTRGVAAKVVGVEDLISLKLQALKDDPSRGRDRVDIEGLLTVHRGAVNMEAVRDYAVALGAENELDQILETIATRAR